MQVTTSIVRMPPRVEIVIRPRWIVDYEWTRGPRLLSVDSAVVMLVIPLEGHLSMPDD
jgi:hypothetical protein